MTKGRKVFKWRIAAPLAGALAVMLGAAGVIPQPLARALAIGLDALLRDPAEQPQVEPEKLGS